MRRRKDDRRHLSITFEPHFYPLLQHKRSLCLQIPAPEPYWSRSDLQCLFFCSSARQIVNVTGSCPDLPVISFPKGLFRRSGPASEAISPVPNFYNSTARAHLPVTALSITSVSTSCIKVREASSGPLLMSDPDNYLLQNTLLSANQETIDGLSFSAPYYCLPNQVFAPNPGNLHRTQHVLTKARTSWASNLPQLH